jgi:hypothetical protein
MLAMTATELRFTGWPLTIDMPWLSLRTHPQAQNSVTDRRDLRFACNARQLRVVLRKAIEEDRLKQQFMNLNTAVVLNEPEFAKALHKEADA